MADRHSQWGACYQYRLMSPLGLYPQTHIEVEGATLYSNKQLVAIVAAEDIELTELLLKVAILISSTEASGRLRFYTFPNIHQLPLNDSPFASFDDLIEDIQHKRSNGYASAGNTIPEFDWYDNAKGASLPPVLGGASYAWADVVIDNDQVSQLFGRLKSFANPRTISALSALAESNQLSCHFQFQQQAVALMLDCLRLMQQVDEFQVDSAQLGTVLSQLGDTAEDYLISRQQMAKEIGPKDFHRLFVQTCTQLRKFLLSL